MLCDVSEVLALIFEFLAFAKDTKIPRRSIPWENYHPCRSWRTLVLNMSSIWGILYGQCSPKWLDFMTKSRTKPNSPIFIRTPLFHQFRSETRPYVLAFDAARFEELWVEGANSEITNTLNNLVKQDVTLTALRRLVFNTGRSCRGLRWGAVAPRLEVLYLRNAPLRFVEGLFPVLQSIKMKLEESDHRITTHEFLQVIKAMPRLRLLKCTRIFSDHNRKPLPAGLQVELNHLEYLDFRALRWQDVCIFDHITSRPLKSFNLQMESFDYDPSHLPNVAPICKFLPPPPSPTSPWKTVLHKQLSGEYNDRGFTMRVQLVSETLSPPPDFRFEGSSSFKHVKQYQHLEIDLNSSLLPSNADILAIVIHDSGCIYPLSTRLSKSFVVDMAAMEELHSNDMTLLLEALVPGHLLDTGTSAQKTFSADLPKATKPAAIPVARSTRQNPNPEARQASKPPRLYLPSLRQAVVVHETALASEWRNTILLRLGQIFQSRSKIGLPILTLKLGGQIDLTDERNDLGDGVTCLLQFLSKDECKRYLATSLRTDPLGH